jgi:S1-C subfamily serine protease
MVMRRIALALALALCGCATSSGEPAAGFASAEIARAYVPLKHSLVPFGHETGASVIVADGIAVTNAHNYEMIDPKRYIARVPGYDLIFYRADGAAPPVSGPHDGERVRAYGQGVDDELRDASGSIVTLHTTLPPTPDCAQCEAQQAFIYEAPAGPGFSGGPVVDAHTGALVGITFAYDDDKDGKRIMYAYDVNVVLKELAKLKQ